MKWFKDQASLFSGVPIALIYGIICRIAFGWGEIPPIGDWFGTMSVAFLFLAPLAIGFVTVYWGSAQDRTRWGNAILMPWASVGIAALIAGVTAYEAFICIVMALPILLAMGSIGGLLACALARARADKNNTSIIGALLLLPYLVAPIEAQFTVHDATAIVESQIEINASAEHVWQEIIRVPSIQEHERSFSPVFDWIGAPKPLAAELNHEGVGGVRIGHFEHGLRFIETIRDWQPGKRIVWSIAADTSQVDEGPWGEIGGKFFDVTAASYWIEPLGDGRVILHLNSTHRLTTHFNAYGLLWTKWGLGEFQEQVLRIVKGRAEER